MTLALYSVPQGLESATHLVARVGLLQLERMDVTASLAQESNPRVVQLVREHVALPPMPIVAERVVREAGRADCTAASLSRVIEKDQSLAATLLGVVNSALYQRPTPAKSTQDAVAFLGLNETRSIALARCTRDLFARFGEVEQGLWEHTVATAVASRVIAREKCWWYREEAFVAGLMHDVGKVVLNNASPGAFRQLLAMQAGDDSAGHALEREIFGVTHMAVGYALTREWGLSEYIQKASLLHHHAFLVDLGGSMSAEREVICVVRLADLLCHAFGIGGPVTPSAVPIWTDPAALILGVEHEELGALYREIKSTFEAERSLF